METSSSIWHRVLPPPLHLRPRPAGGPRWPALHPTAGVLVLRRWRGGGRDAGWPGEGPPAKPRREQKLPWCRAFSCTVCFPPGFQIGFSFAKTHWRALSLDTQCRVLFPRHGWSPAPGARASQRHGPCLPAVAVQRLLPGLCPATRLCRAEGPSAVPMEMTPSTEQLARAPPPS